MTDLSSMTSSIIDIMSTLEEMKEKVAEVNQLKDDLKIIYDENKVLKDENAQLRTVLSHIGELAVKMQLNLTQEKIKPVLTVEAAGIVLSQCTTSPLTTLNEVLAKEDFEPQSKLEREICYQVSQHWYLYMHHENGHEIEVDMSRMLPWFRKLEGNYQARHVIMKKLRNKEDKNLPTIHDQFGSYYPVLKSKKDSIRTQKH